MKKFVIGRIKSTRYALQGFWLLVRTEDAIITHSIGFLVFVGLFRTYPNRMDGSAFVLRGAISYRRAQYRLGKAL